MVLTRVITSVRSGGETGLGSGCAYTGVVQLWTCRGFMRLRDLRDTDDFRILLLRVLAIGLVHDLHHDGAGAGQLRETETTVIGNH